MSTDQALNRALSTAIAAWRKGLHPPLQVISQLFDAGLDVDLIAHQHSGGVIPLPFGAKTTMSTQVMTKSEPFRLDVQIIDGEPRVLDTDLARQLGMANVYKIRELVRANAEELQSFGVLSPQRGETSNKGGRPGEEFYLNRQQALLICILSKTPRAREVRAEVIRRFDAYEVPAAPVSPVLSPDMAHLTGLVTVLVQTVQGLAQTLATKAPEPATLLPKAPTSASSRKEPKAPTKPSSNGGIKRTARGRAPSYSREDIALILALAAKGSSDRDIGNIVHLTAKVVADVRRHPEEASAKLKKWNR